ncbi:oxidoreductase [Anderseniella sp. Alg231-50]|uniref:oxidoreductase n=1 Tax=Anderseniella sp. Alg231-50 TaxID=1922226 RepID=UPI000D550ABE
MPRDPRYDVLFEPVKVGPVTAKNRFYQVPHCTGMGWLRPNTLAAMRGVKAEGGWGVVNTEYCSIHPTSDDLPYPYASLWDASDIRAHAKMTGNVHEHGALAGVELWHGGSRSSNQFSRDVAIGVTSLPSASGVPFQSRAMDKQDIAQLRRWHRDAALRAREAEFDLVYVYAAHGYLLSHFLSAQTNHRTDEYGGNLRNRTRLCRELIEETKQAVGDKCAVAVRFAVDGLSDDNESRDMFSLMAEMPDLWDITVHDYSHEMGVSRFVGEASLEPLMSFVKSATTKPVVTVGRFTSPDTMVSHIRRGVSDFIGAARPSIADPFLPNKIADGRPEDIRECIGCNICYAGDGLGVPIRCTQNPAMGEEWRKGWHPETISAKQSNDKILVVGAGPAGLECARALGQRGYEVMLSEARRELGGRVTLEARLPGLSEWARVRDYRTQQLQAMANVQIFPESELSADDVALVEPDHVVIATGSSWRNDGLGRSNTAGISRLQAPSQIFTPDDIMAGRLPEGRVLVFDDDNYYMAAVVAELLNTANASVTYVTPENLVASFGAETAEQHGTQKRLIELGVDLVLAHNLHGFDGNEALLKCIYTERDRTVLADAIVMVTARSPNEALYRELLEGLAQGSAGPMKSVRRIGDCEAPAIIAAAVYAGHRYAREFDAGDASDNDVKRDGVET